ncbi:MAG: hypothetical protein HYR64_05290 [Fimbriimonas ginsengisoli]|uniref:Uncharacterized protein n=1 Tax=Fimbriimonas ginsengisoli TaxID=1005039 RepID=A0A931LS85_FIMGI|nr:hypothetical protein [Fimbriimonas ginsengisoli]
MSPLLGFPLAAIESDMIAAVTVPIVFATIPIVAMLLRHQRRMAELIHGAPTGRQAELIEQLRQDIAGQRKEIADLRELMHQQTIALDSGVSARLQPPASPAEVSTRAIEQ